MQRLFLELRFAVRGLRRSPGFAVTAVVTLALGIGATTAIFSAVYGLLLQSLPFEDAGRIVAVAETHAQVAGGTEATFPDYEDWRAQQRSFTEIAAYSTLNPNTVSMVMDGRANQIHRVLASGNFFAVLGVRAMLGRTLEARDDSKGSDTVAVLSYEAWRRYFGGDERVVGRGVDLNGASFTVIGVLPPRAAYPVAGEVWLPLSQMDAPTRASRVWHSVKVLGRLKAGVDLAAARVDMQTTAARLAAAYPATNRNEGVMLLPLREQLVGTLRPAMLSLFGAVLLVLAIACANVASLLMVRATAERREIALREALGADRWRLLARSLAQTGVLCLTGGVLGVALAWGALPLLRLALESSAGVDAAMMEPVRLSWPVMLFAFGVCALTAVVFGLLPVMRRSSETGRIAQALRSGDRAATPGSKWRRGGLIASEIAIAVVVMFLGALVVRSYARLLVVDPGFRVDHLLSAEITLPGPKYTDTNALTTQFYERLLAKLAQAPGVIAAGTTTQTPLRPSQVMTRFAVVGAPAPAPGAYPLAQIRFVSPEFFRTMGLAVREGRVFSQKDVDENVNAFVVNETFAKKYLAGRGAVGSKVLIGVLSPQPSSVPVIGVVADAHDLGVEAKTDPELYLPGYGVHAVLLVRSAYDAAGLASVASDAVRGIDPGLAAYNVKTVDAVLSESLARQRMTAVLLGIFAVVAVLLAAVGIYGVLSYSVGHRTREIGVRMAVGASRGAVLRLVIWQAGVFVAGGLVAGLAGALAGARLMRGMLFETSTVDAMSIAVTVVAMALVALLAVSLPAGRAAGVDPVETLRAE